MLESFTNMKLLNACIMAYSDSVSVSIYLYLPNDLPQMVTRLQGF